MAKPLPFWRRMLGRWLAQPTEPRVLELPPPVVAGTARVLSEDGRHAVELRTVGGQLDTSAPARVRPARRRREQPRRGWRDYEAAGQGRNNSGWWAPNTAANVEIRKSLAVLRARSRDLCRNNAHAERAIAILVANLIGDGIRPRSATGSVALDKRVNDLWDAWTKVADPFHGLDFYGVQALAVRAWLESGEVLIRRRVRRLDDGLPVPFQLEVMESDLLDPWRLGELPNGGRIVQGVEFDPINRRAAYWILPFHPGDSSIGFGRASALGVGSIGDGAGLVTAEGFTSRPIPAGEIVHLYQPKRPGQVRGVPWLATVAQDIRDLDDYAYAERVRKRIEACMVAFVIGNTPSDVPPDQDGIAPAVEDSDGNPIEEFSPGMVALVRDGKDVRVHAPAASPDYAGYKKAELQEIAAGAGVTFEQLTGDLGGVSFASYRVGRVEFFRAMRALHNLLIVPKLCAPVWAWFVEMAQASGALPVRAEGYPCKWASPRFESIERDKDASADKLEIRNGTRSLTDVIASYGRDPRSTLEEIAEAFKLVDELGLVLDVDPRRTVAAGSAASGAAGPAGGDAAADTEEAPEPAKP